MFLLWNEFPYLYFFGDRSSNLIMPWDILLLTENAPDLPLIGNFPSLKKKLYDTWNPCASYGFSAFTIES